MADLEALARRLRDAADSRTPCAPLKETDPDLSVEDAYRIQQINLEARGGRLVGHKIGITSEAVMSWLKVDEPDFGGLLADMEVDDGGKIAADTLLQPKVEGEIAFVLGRELRGPVSLAEVVRATDFVLPSIEVIDSRVADWKIKYEDTIADNASSARYSLGTRPVKLGDFDPRLVGMTLRKNGRVVSTGAGAACLGNPVNAVRWLANKMGELDQSLPAGSVLLSGALGPVTPVAAGDFVELEISGLGATSVRFV
jgi:2-oxopent-4-enoate/cis-2-oxohex-4-enoate hydratase